MSNFTFLQSTPAFASFAPVAVAAEKILPIDPSAAVINCRRAMEFAVKWMYSVDGSLVLPYDDRLASLMDNEDFRDVVGPDVWQRMKLIRLLVRALKKYVGEGNPQATQEAAAIRMTLSQRLKALRTEHGFTQELVAASLGVSRQAVSKWENGTSEPSTSNLFALAKLYGISVTELLQNIET